MILIFGLLSGLIHARQTGEGQVVDTAITDGSAYIASLLRMMHNTGQISDDPGSGWADFGAPWNDTYACADGGFITVCPLEPQFYAELVTRLGLDGDPLFADQWDKSQWPAAKARMVEMFGGKTRDEWCALLEGTDVCFAPVLNMSESVTHPHNVARETFLTLDGVVQPAPAPRFSRTPPEVGACPVPGQHTDEIVAALGLDRSALRESGAI